MRPGAVAKAHYHKGVDTIAYMLEGECAVYYDGELEKRADLHLQLAIQHPHPILAFMGEGRGALSSAGALLQKATAASLSSRYGVMAKVQCPSRFTTESRGRIIDAAITLTTDLIPMFELAPREL